MWRRSQIVSGLLILAVVLVMACAPQAVPVPAPTPTKAVAPAPAPATAAPVATAAPGRPAWEEKWERTLEAAKREGKVSLALGTGGNVIRLPMAEAFRKTYGIPVEAMVARGAELGRKVIVERQAGLYNYDAALVASSILVNALKPAGSFDPLEPVLILPELTDPELIKRTWWQGKLWWIDSDRTLLTSTLRLNFSIAFNTNLVKEGEIKSYRDLLNPKWKGKMILNDPTVAGPSTSFLSFANATLGWDFLVELAKTGEPLVLRDQRLQLDWLSHGKVALVVAPEQPTLLEFTTVGAPVKGIIPAEGTWLVGADGNVAMFNKTPHPNAAKLFINWVLSKEGQKVIPPPLASQSLRLDVPTDHLPPERVRQEGVKYFSMEDEKVALELPALQKKVGELLAPLMK